MKSLIEIVEGNEGNSSESTHKVVEIKKGKQEGRGIEAQSRESITD